MNRLFVGFNSRWSSFMSDLEVPTSHSATVSRSRTLQDHVPSRKLESVSSVQNDAISSGGSDGDAKIIEEIGNSRKHIKENGEYKPKLFDAWALVVTTVLIGQYFGWNVGIKAGCGSYIVGQILIGIAYIFLAFSLAEIVSTTSFSGGAYGMARVVLGFYPGFLVAAFELMEYMTYISFAVAYLADFFLVKFNSSEDNFPWLCFVLYVLLAFLFIDQNYFFWRINYIFAVSILIILLVYCFGSLPYVNLTHYGPLKYAPTDDYAYYGTSGTSGNSSTSSNSTTTGDDYYDPNSQQAWFNGGMVGFLQLLPYATWGFAGVESAALITDMMENPRVNLSYGIAASVLTLFATMMFVMFVAMSLPTGADDLYYAEYLMNAGFEKIGINNNAAEWLTVPGQVAMAFGFTIPSYKLLQAISSSKLLPTQLGIHKYHMLAVIIVLIISYLLCLLAFYVPDIDLSNIATIFACFTYLSDLYAYYRMKIDFSTRDHKFSNPFGIAGACFAACMFILTIISLVFYQADYNTPYAVIVYVGILTVYYFSYAKKYQQFSDDEQKSLLVLHVMKTNIRKRAPRARKWLVKYAPVAPSKNQSAFNGNSSVAGDGGVSDSQWKSSGRSPNRSFQSGVVESIIAHTSVHQQIEQTTDHPNPKINFVE